ncbi:MAG: PKD domain-containing protein [Hyphomicrobiales bacterium]
MIPSIRAIVLGALVVYLGSIPRITQAQYMYLDSNGDGVHTDADVLPASGSTTIDVWVVTDQDRDGDPAVCIESGDPFTFNSYQVILHATGGTITWGAFQNAQQAMTIDVGHAADSTDFVAGFAGTTYHPAGRYQLGSVTATPAGGAPSIQIVAETSLARWYLTAIGSGCVGLEFDNTLKLGSDWFDVDGLPSSAGGLPPSIEHMDDVAMSEGDFYARTVAANDADGDSIALAPIRLPRFASWQSSVAAPGRSTATLSLAPGFQDAGVYVMAIGASDGGFGTSQTVTVSVQNVNHAPVLEPIADATMEVATTLDVPVHATDQDGERLTLGLAGAPPYAQAVVGSNAGGVLAGAVRFTPGIADTGTEAVEVAVSDGIAVVRGSFQITVRRTKVYNPPVIAPIDDVTMDLGDTLFRDVSADDADGDWIHLRIASGPRYASLTGPSGLYTPIEGYGHSYGALRLAPFVGDSGSAAIEVEADDGVFQTLRSVSVYVRYRNLPPSIPPAYDECIEPGLHRAFGVRFEDPEGDSVLVAVSGLPTWAYVKQWGGGAIYILAEPPIEEPQATYPIEVDASQAGGWHASVPFMLTVTAIGECSGGVVFAGGGTPVVEAGGPYAGVAGAPVRFQGTATSDGHVVADSLSFRWTFGDGHASFGAGPTHVYAEGGSYLAMLWLWGAAPDSATVTVADAYPARAYVPAEDKQIVLAAARPSLCIRMEAPGGEYGLADVDPSSFLLESAGTGTVDSIFCIGGKETHVLDRDHNGVQELEACFARDDLRRLFATVRGRVEVEARLEGRLWNGARLRAPITLMVVGHPGTNGDVAIRPNPLNPSGTISFTTSREGRARVRIYDVKGRLVRTLLDRRMPAGPLDVRFDGRDGVGRDLASGVYYYRVETVDGDRTGRLTILK